MDRMNLMSHNVLVVTETSHFCFQALSRKEAIERTCDYLKNSEPALKVFICASGSRNIEHDPVDIFKENVEAVWEAQMSKKDYKMAASSDFWEPETSISDSLDDS
jgi:hypothetical protein